MPQQGPSPQGEPTAKAQPSLQAGPAGAQARPPARGSGAGRAGRGPSYDGSGQAGDGRHLQHSSSEDGSPRVSSSRSGVSSDASVAGSVSNARAGNGDSAGHGGGDRSGGGKQTASSGSTRQQSVKSTGSSSTAGSQGVSSSTGSSATVAATGAPSSTAAASAPKVSGTGVQPARAPSTPGHSARPATHRPLSTRTRRPSGGVAVASGAALAAFTQVATQPARIAPARTRSAPQKSSNPLARLGGQIPLPIPVPDWSKPIIIALLLLAAWFGVRSRLAARRARRLERQRAVLLRDVGALQAALVPEVPALLGGLAVSVAYRPAEGPAAGGDFYDLFSPEPGKVAMMLGDVAGHGHSALTHAALTRYTLRAYLQAGLEPRAALALAGRVLADPLGERYATVAVGVYDTAAGKLTYALAGHPPPILSGFQAREPVTLCSSPPVGWGAPTGRRQTTISLPEGAAACFFSDGLIEARSGGELLGRERLGEILAGLGAEPGAAELLENVRAAAEGAPDDMVACVLSPEDAPGDGCMHVEELEADAQALCKDDVRRFLEECLVPASEIAQVIEQASAIAESHGSAVLRVELAGARPTAGASVSAPGSHAAGSESPSAEHSAGEPLLEALLAG